MDRLMREMVRQMSAERAVIELFVATDRRDWLRVRRLFTDQVEVDMSSLGGAVGRVDADALVAAWEAGLAPLDAVHHQVGNIRSTIHEDEAHVACHGVAFHHLRTETAGRTRRFVGTYDIGLQDSPRGWHIHTFRFDLRFSDGDL